MDVLFLFFHYLLRLKTTSVNLLLEQFNDIQRKKMDKFPFELLNMQKILLVNDY